MSPVLLPKGKIMSLTTAKKPKQDTISKVDNTKVIEKLITARVSLLMRHPFFGNLATRMQLVDSSDWCSTLATDGRNFYYNAHFVDQLTPKEVEFGFGHEVLHNVFDHLGRKGSRNQTLFNIAADYAVNQILKDENIGKVPSHIKIFQNDKYRSWSFEQIYEDLEKNATKIDIGGLGELLDEHLTVSTSANQNDSNGSGNRPVISEDELKKIRDEVKEAMIAAVQSAGAGKVPNGVMRIFKELTEPKMNWKDMLQMNIQSILKNNFSFSRPNRKSQHSGAILPGLLQENTISVAVAIDLSGSISDKQAKDFLSEVKGIMDQYQDFEIDLWCFDTAVYNHQKFTSDNGEDLLNYQLKGGGGTDFDVNFQFMKNNDIEPKKFIMFTDGYPCGSWGDKNYVDTLFVIYGSKSIIPPFGQVAYYE
jgi:predicted metal-dependent peptidase